MEKWKDIDKYKGYYQISNKGRVRSLDRIVNNRYGKRVVKSRQMKVFKDSYGYGVVSLCKNGKTEMTRVHRLIAEVFIPNPENKPCINHKNGIKYDNRMSNIEWCTYKENNNHAIKNGLNNQKGELHNGSILTKDDVIRIRSIYGKGGNTLRSLAKDYGVNFTTIQAVVSKRSWGHI